MGGLPGYHPDEKKVASRTEELRSINELQAATSSEDVAALMNATFSARRRAVVIESATIADIHQDYPAIFERKELSDSIPK